MNQNQRHEGNPVYGDSAWHDLVLYLIGRDVGPVAAQAVSKFFALQRHVDGLAPFIVFGPPREHGDAVVAAAQA